MHVREWLRARPAARGAAHHGGDVCVLKLGRVCAAEDAVCEAASSGDGDGCKLVARDGAVAEAGRKRGRGIRPCGPARARDVPAPRACAFESKSPMNVKILPKVLRLHIGTFSELLFSR
eukprot:6180637-Pleurochrysis_carterae.AAC.2